MSTNEHQTYAGYLKKQGALFKQWKERYFVLDSIKHQVMTFEVCEISFQIIFNIYNYNIINIIEYNN